MTGATVADPGYPVSRCAPCGRDVLLHVVPDGDGELRRCCLHCDAEIDPAEVRWVDEAALDRLGYGLVAEGGCGKPGCGQGRCGRS